jgi:hypothetical protein
LRLRYLLARESLRNNLITLLRYWFGCSIMVAFFNGWLETAYLATHSFSYILAVSAVIGAPLAVLAWLAFKILRFLFAR